MGYRALVSRPEHMRYLGSDVTFDADQQPYRHGLAVAIYPDPTKGKPHFPSITSA